MSFAMLIATLAVLPAIFALPSTDLELDRRLITRQTEPSDPNNIPTNWTFVGCFSDSAPASRTLLSAQATDNSALTPLLCTEFCSGTSENPVIGTPFNFAGTEFVSQCFCDYNIQGTAMQLPNSSCNFPCGGDETLTCGGASTISIYQNHNPNVGPLPSNKPNVGIWEFLGCYMDRVGENPSTLSIRLPIESVTVETCTAACQANGFILAGLEFGQECWCGNTILVSNATAPVSDCSMACLADHTELCGGPNRLTIYINDPNVMSNDIPANWTIFGCFSDSSTARTLQSEQFPVKPTPMTPLLCTELCSSSTPPFNFAGTESEDQCFCDFNIQGTAMQLADSACELPCIGDDTLTCGGNGTMNIYQNHNLNVGPLPSNKPNVTGGWEFLGCFTNSLNGSAPILPVELGLVPGQPGNVETCTAECLRLGHLLAGIEGGQECWCGDALGDPEATAPFGDCSMACLGDPTEFCGGPNRLTIYFNDEL